MIILSRDCLCISCRKEECEYKEKIKSLQRELSTFGPGEMATIFQVTRCPLFLPNQQYLEYIAKKEEK